MGVKRVWKFEGPNAVEPIRWYLELIKGVETRFDPHGMISEEQYEAAPPQTKRNIDGLVRDGILVTSEEE